MGWSVVGWDQALSNGMEHLLEETSDEVEHLLTVWESQHNTAIQVSPGYHT